jgi:hypothetical protein
MGCLKFIIKVAIVVLAIVGFKSLGGWDWCVKTFHIGQKPTQQSMIEKTKDVADFSKIPDEYELSKSANICKKSLEMFFYRLFCILKLQKKKTNSL